MNQKMSSLISITILYFARVKDITGVKKETMELPLNTSIKKLLAKISLSYPDIKSILNVVKISVNYKMIDMNTILKDGDEVALLPPVSGG
jgi:molybdopterin converting factor subunit 1